MNCEPRIALDDDAVFYVKHEDIAAMHLKQKFR